MKNPNNTIGNRNIVAQYLNQLRQRGRWR